MDPVTGAVLTIIGKYAIDQGVALTKEYGPQAAETAKRLFHVALDKLRQRGKGMIVDEYADDPETWTKPVEKEVDAAIEADETFATEARTLAVRFDAQAAAHAAAAGKTYSAMVRGDRNVVVTGDGNVVATGGSAAAGGNIEGGITIGRDKS